MQTSVVFNTETGTITLKNEVFGIDQLKQRQFKTSFDIFIIEAYEALVLQERSLSSFDFEEVRQLVFSDFFKGSNHSMSLLS
jgi:hypothetical protein